MAEQSEFVALYIKPAPSQKQASSTDFQWTTPTTYSPGESNQAFMAKVIAGLQQAKAESDKFLTPFVEQRK